MYKVIKSQKRRRLFLILLEIIIGIGVYAFVFYSDLILGEKIEYTWEILLGYIVLVFFFEIISTISVFNKFDIQTRKNHQNINFLLGADIAEGYRFSQLGMLYYDADLTILWTSELFEERHVQLLGQNLLDWQPVLNELLTSEDEKKEVILTIQQRKYSAICLKELQIILFKDVSDIQGLLQTREEQAPLIATIVIDNFAELTSISNETIVSEIENETRKIIAEWAKKYDLVLRRYKEDAYLALFNETTFEKMKNDEFNLLNKVKNYRTSIDFHLTMSIGIGRGSYDFKVLSELASSAIDIALSRGGDQVVINNYGSNLEFFGGTTNSKAKRNLVRSRTLAQSFIAHMKTSNTVLVMGHSNLDMDALGACLGVYSIAKKINKEAYIIWDDKLVETKARMAMHAMYNRMELQNIILSQAQANAKLGSDTLLVVVDCHSAKMTLYPDAVEKSPNIAIIDHHRKVEDAIENSNFSFHDSSSSSACELVAELIRYSDLRYPISEKVATLMLSGILLDTNYYRRQTGIRTYESSAFLKEYGASTEEADNFLKDDYEEYLLKTKIMNNVETPMYGILVAKTNKDDIVERAFLAKVANESLTLKDVKAVFVIGRTEMNEVSISARSDGTVNVQLILEKMGGGGHFNAAGVNRKGKALQETYQELIKILNLYLNDATSKKGG